MTKINAAIVASVAILASAAQAQSVHNGSQASALSAAGLSATVAFVPMSVAIGGSQLSALTAQHLSRLLSEEADWIVDQVTGREQQTELKLRSKNKGNVIVVGVPTQSVQSNAVVVTNQVRFDKLGTAGYALKKDGKTLAVMVTNEVTIGHSVKK